MEDCPIFDEHERNSDLFFTLDLLNMPYTRQTLGIGDSVVSERCAIEIKRVSHTNHDLKSSLFDGRLYEQSEQRRDNFEISIIIIEITAKHKLFDAHFTKQHLKSLEFSLIIDFNSHVYYTESTESTIKLIYKIWEKLRKGKRYVIPINKQKIPLTLKQKQVRLLTGLLDVGEIKATGLIRDWKNPMNVFNWIIHTEHQYDVFGFAEEFFKKNRDLLQG